MKNMRLFKNRIARLLEELNGLIPLLREFGTAAGDLSVPSRISFVREEAILKKLSDKPYPYRPSETHNFRTGV